MSVHAHILRGCAPTPLAHYLKALGVLRLVAEQKDESARGAWRDDTFVLVTKLTEEELVRFFLEEYAPTPLLSPWNRGSGFFYESDAVLGAIRRASAERLAAYKEAIIVADAALADLQAAAAEVRAIKELANESTPQKKKELKADPEYRGNLAAAERRFKALKDEEFLPRCRLIWRGPALRWMTAAVTLEAHGKASYPALLGTGGSDGRLDFTYNAMARLGELFDIASEGAPPQPQASTWLGQSLFDSLALGMGSSAIGQFHPGGAGGANSTNGTVGNSSVNPWDFLLMLEGTVCFQSAASRRLGVAEGERGSAPFTTRGHAVGAGSASSDEESARGEQWMPLWNQPITLKELEGLLAEGRAQIGSNPARRPLDFVRAVARLGTSRGIRAFMRFGYLERNGQSNLAVPLGRFVVANRPHVRLLDDLESWLARLHRASRVKHAPARLRVAEHNLADAAFAGATRDDSTQVWQQLLLSMSAIEAIQAHGSGAEAGPIPQLQSGWITVANDGTPEYALALALASAFADYEGSEGHLVLGPVRHHFLPLDRIGKYTRFATNDQKQLRHDVRVVCNGRDPITDLVALVQRRLIEAAATGQRTLPLQAPVAMAARTPDLALMLAGQLDLGRVLGLARALMPLSWRNVSRDELTPRRLSHDLPPEPWCVIRLALLPWPLRKGVSIPADSAIVRRLAAGDASRAFDIAARRLRAVGIRPAVTGAVAAPDEARRWAAALAFPISHRTTQQLVARVDPAFASENSHAH